MMRYERRKRMHQPGLKLGMSFIETGDSTEIFVELHYVMQNLKT